MDSSFFLIVVAAAVGFLAFLGIPFFMVYRKFKFQQENKDLYSSSSSPSYSSSPSASSQLPSSLSDKWTHDVFPSFRGEDVRRNLLSHIQKEFRRKGITPFIDNEIKRGESIGPELIQAIRRSKIAIVLLSRNYASSKWCLDELVEIMNCKKELGQTVFAIFYEVDPSHVKKLTGEFGSIFKKTCVGNRKEDIGRWRQAFAEVATIAGYDSRNWDNESIMIEEIVSEISKRLINSAPSRDLEGLIGMGAHIKNMKQLICLGSDETRTIGIYGPSGIGKTTIARVLYNHILDGFELSVFMKFKPSYARPTCSDDHDVKLHLEQQFLSQLLNQEDIKIPHLGAAQNFLTNKKVLVILDGVDQLVQLHAMPKARFLGPGTRIIITTQDQKLLNAFKIGHIYKVNLPPLNEALQIFCMNAFGQNSPCDGFEKLSWEVTYLAGRLPLGLRVMGSHFRGMSKEEWKGGLARLRNRLDGEIGSILKLSYDALNEEDKDLFLHIACFFNDEGIDHTFEDTLGKNFLDVWQGFRVLVQRCLISNHIHFPMHNLLVQLGREIVRNQSIHEPGKRQFLVDTKDICEVLTENTGSKSVLGIRFDFSWIEEDQNICEKVFEEMSSLQFLSFRRGYGNSLKRLQFPQGLNYLPPKLRILHWANYPMTCLPSKFNPKFLVKIKMEYSKLENLWEGIQPLRNLRLMSLRHSDDLTGISDLSTATNLQDLDLNGCSSLVKLPSSIGNAISLQNLNLGGCSKLVELPFSVGNAINLQELNVEGCSSLVELPFSIGNAINLRKISLINCKRLLELPNSIGKLTNLHDLYLSGCSSLLHLPSSIGNAINLHRLSLSECKSLVELPSTIGNLTNLDQFVLHGCSSLIELPYTIGNAINLRRMNLHGCLNLVKLPLSIENVTNLISLDLSGSSSLVELPSTIGNVTSLQELNLKGCSSLVHVPFSIGNATNLQNLNFEGCSSLMQLPFSIGKAPNLLALNFKGCSSLMELPSSVGNATNLQVLNLQNCSRLMELPSSVGNASNLQRLYLQRCSRLVELPSSIGNATNLQKLNLNGCISLVDLPISVGNLSSLYNLDLGGCLNLAKLPSTIGTATNLQELNLKGCTSIVELPISIGNAFNLFKLDLSGCSSLVDLPSSIGNLTMLKELNLEGCSNLVELPFSIGNAKNLKKLNLIQCSSLVRLPSSIGNAINLKDLNLFHCKNLVELPCSIENASHLEELNLGLCSSLVALPFSTGNANHLQKLYVNGCSSLSELPSSIWNSTSLKNLYITNFVELPSDIGNLTNLQNLNVNRCLNLLKLPSSIGNAVRLKKLSLSRCPNLVELPSSIGNLTNLQELDLNRCSGLVELPSSIGRIRNLLKLNLSGCSSFVKLSSSIGNLINLQDLNLSHCSSLLELPSSIGSVINLHNLNLSDCSNIVELPFSIGNIINLKRFNLDGCSSLVEIPSSIGNLHMLLELSLQGCSKLVTLPIGINLKSLTFLDVTGCTQLMNFPEISTKMKWLMLCGTSIKGFPMSIMSWSQLQDMSITYCKSLEEFPHALDAITELELNNTEIVEVPPWINGISGLRRLVLNKCTKLVSLPQLPGSLTSLDAKSCESLETLACSFPNPEICLRFVNCWNLNEKARDIIIQTSTTKYAVVPGSKVPAFFTYRATTRGSLTVKLSQRHFPTSLRFRTCIMLVNKGEKGAGDEVESKVLVSCTIKAKQNDLKFNTITRRLRNHQLHPPLTDHLYTFEDQTDNVESSELFFEFKAHSDIWEIGECGLCEL